MMIVFVAPVLISLEQPQHPKPLQSFRAVYDWGFASPSGEGKGTLAVLLEPASGKLILELHALGERVMLLEGNANDGYRVQIPRDSIDEQASAIGGLPIPFLPALNDAEGLALLLTKGMGPNVKASRKDRHGPKRLRWDGRDGQNNPCTVWLKRSRYEPL